jgi:hypothetical protein
LSVLTCFFVFLQFYHGNSEVYEWARSAMEVWEGPETKVYIVCVYHVQLALDEWRTEILARDYPSGLYSSSLILRGETIALLQSVGPIKSLANIGCPRLKPNLPNSTNSILGISPRLQWAQKSFEALHCILEGGKYGTDLGS